MKFKIILIIIISFFITIIIYKSFSYRTYNLTIIGDDLSLGINPYNEICYNYGDYLKDFLIINQKLHNYNNQFTNQIYFISDLERDLNNNIIKNKKNIKNIISNSNILILSIGNQDFLNILNQESIDKYNEIDKLFLKFNTLISNITKFNIKYFYIIGFYNKNSKNLNYLQYSETKFKKLTIDYNLNYISLSEIYNNPSKYFPNPKSNNINNLGQKYISTKIITNLRQKVDFLK